MKKYLYTTIPRFQSKPMTYKEEPSHYVQISKSIKAPPREKEDGVPSGELFKLHHTEPNKIFGLRKPEKPTLELTTEKEDGVKPSFGRTPIAYYEQGYDKFKDMKDFVKHTYDNNEDTKDAREEFEYIQTRPAGERSVLSRLLAERKTKDGKLTQLKQERTRRQGMDYDPDDDPEDLANNDDIELENLMQGKKEKFKTIMRAHDSAEVERDRKQKIQDLTLKNKKKNYKKVKIS